jgi:hypothetical protein
MIQKVQAITPPSMPHVDGEALQGAAPVGSPIFFFSGTEVLINGSLGGAGSPPAYYAGGNSLPVSISAQQGLKRHRLYLYYAMKDTIFPWRVFLNLNIAIPFRNQSYDLPLMVTVGTPGGAVETVPNFFGNVPSANGLQINLGQKLACDASTTATLTPFSVEGEISKITLSTVWKTYSDPATIFATASFTGHLWLGIFSY